MRVLPALSIIAIIGSTNYGFAGQSESVTNNAATETRTIALLNEPVLLNRDDATQAECLEAKSGAPSDEPLLLNRDFAESQTSEHLDPLPSAVASLDLPLARVLVDDEGIALIDVDYTGSAGPDSSYSPVPWSELAIDGYEDR